MGKGMKSKNRTLVQRQETLQHWSMLKIQESGVGIARRGIFL